MHIERYSLPSGVNEVFFSGRFWYAASEKSNAHGRPIAVGVGSTKDGAIADMRDILEQKGHQP